MSEAVQNPDDWEVAPGFGHAQLQGWTPELSSEEELRDALEKAFDYRGDITLTRKDGTTVEGYLYDRRSGPSLQQSLVRILPQNGSARVSIPYSEIAALSFSGRDTAAGKSWEAWLRKYWERKAAGAPAEIEPENLE
jgi:hypothetical protein